MTNTLEYSGRPQFLLFRRPFFHSAGPVDHAEVAFSCCLATPELRPATAHTDTTPQTLGKERAADAVDKATPASQAAAHQKVHRTRRAQEQMASTMGASRDLTRTFVEWRAMREKSLGGARTFGGYERGSSQEHSPMSSSRAALPPVWVDVVEKVETDVATLERALKSLKEAHRARLMVSFDESREAELDREIERQSQNATQLFRACEKTLKRVATFGGDAADDSERKVRANVQRSVAVRIQALNTEFRRAQKDYVVRLKSQ